MAALGGAGFLAAFAWQDLVVPVVVAALTGVVAHLLAPPGEGPRAPWRPPAAVAAVLVGAAAALRSGPLVLLDGVRQGPRDILGAALPAPGDARALAVPYLLTVAAAFAGAALASRPAGPGGSAAATVPGGAGDPAGPAEPGVPARSEVTRAGAAAGGAAGGRGGFGDGTGAGRAPGGEWRGGWRGRIGRWLGPLDALGPAVPGFGLLVAGLSFGGTDGLARATWVPPVWAGLVLVTLADPAGRPGAAGGVASAADAAPGGHQSLTTAAGGTAGPGGPGGAGGTGGPTSPASLDPVGRARVRWSRRVAGVAMAGLAVLVALPVSRAVPGRDATDRVLLPRTGSPVALPEQANPLARVTALHSRPDDLLFVAETSAPVPRWRLAVLDRYDGVRWSSDRVYRPAGGRLPPPPEGSTPGVAGAAGVAEQVEQRVELVARPGRDGDLPWGRWLPVADRAVELAAGGVLFDVAGGTAVVPADRTLPGGYEAVSLVGEPDAARLVDASVATDPEAAAARRVPTGVPEELTELARQVAAGAESDYAVAAAIQDLLMGERFRLVTTDPPGGHTLGHLARFVGAAATVTPGAGSADAGARGGGPAAGSVEQFVATFAVVARLAGLPSRVVVGFHGTGAAGGRQEVRAHDATAWVEVKLEGLGWVVFDPVPDADAFVPAPDEPAVDPDDIVSPEDTLPEGGADGDRGGDAEDGDDRDATPGSSVRLWAAGLALAVLAAAGVAAPGARRWWRRRHRRRARTPAGGVVASWLTAVDELRVAGVEVAVSRPVTEVVADGRRQLGPVADPLVPLGALANRCRYGTATVTDHQAQQAWALCDAFVAARRRGRPVAQRAREYVGMGGRRATASRSGPSRST